MILLKFKVLLVLFLALSLFFTSAQEVSANVFATQPTNVSLLASWPIADGLEGNQQLLANDGYKKIETPLRRDSVVYVLLRMPITVLTGAVFALVGLMRLRGWYLEKKKNTE